MIFCVWPYNAQTSCTIKSNTFNHRMLKPKGKDKIRNVTGTGQTMNWQSIGWKSRLTHQTTSVVLVTERNTSVKLLCRICVYRKMMIPSRGKPTLSPSLRSFQKGWMWNQEPSFPAGSRETRMAFFSSKAGRRLFTVRYLLLLMCRSWDRRIGMFR